ncbi:hypothetical protein PF007_g29732 [Phytophthora fragariae]|uniref:Uncharacterized protein n=3 Tax=Phytophthora fragariae TaxID=53985 RepID=A0A6A3PT05_9STRA|nr:hypothetical protein PF007_g29732 [Phytophthora fragariae]
MHTFGSAAMARNASTRRQGLPPPEANPPEERLAPHEASMVDLLQAPLSPTASLPSPLGRTDPVAASVSADAGMASSVMASAASRGAQHRSTQRSRRQGRAALRAGDESHTETVQIKAYPYAQAMDRISFASKKMMNERPVKLEEMSTARTSGLLVSRIPKKKRSGILVKDGEAIPGISARDIRQSRRGSLRNDQASNNTVEADQDGETHVAL